jgi:ubiquinone/menaquinone biosynthesis C-methylase UbiE
MSAVSVAAPAVPVPASSALYRLWLTHAPRPRGIGRRRLLDVLAPHPGERMLEIGPGGGYNSVAVARRLAPHGRLTLVDVDTSMLISTLGRLRKKGVGHLVSACRADARSLPFERHSFDAAFLVAVLGEVGDVREALAEARRVVRPGGRIVVGELRLDPQAFSAGRLRELADELGLELETPAGGFAYTARFRRP